MIVLRPLGRLAPVLILMLALLVQASIVAGAPSGPTARFDATLTATVTKDWRSSTAAPQGECTRTISRQGRRTVSMRSSRPSRLAVNRGADGRVRFLEPVVRSIGVTAAQGGSRTTQLGGQCRRSVSRSNCSRMSRTFPNEKTRLTSRVRDEVSFVKMRDVVSRSVLSSCPGEPATARARRPGIELASGRLPEKQLFDPSITQITATGSYDQTTQVDGDETTVVVEQVRWTLVLRRR